MGVMFYLGTILVAAGLAKNNTTTAVPFTLPASLDTLYFQSDVAAVQAEFGNANAFATTAARGAFTGAVNALNGPFKTKGRGSLVLSVFNPTGGPANIKVYAG